MTSISKRLKEALDMRGMKQTDLVKMTGIGKSSISTYLSGDYEPKQRNIYKLAKALNVNEAWLMGYDVNPERKNVSSISNDYSPNVTEDTTSFPVIGEIAAGYDHIATEDWEGDTIDIPNSYLAGHSPKDFFVLRIVGDSMYPLYHHGDKVLILKQSTLNESGDIGAIIYDNEIATLKKIEYIKGEDWLRLVPINPLYKPEIIEGSRLEQCRIIGIPRLLIREF